MLNKPYNKDGNELWFKLRTIRADPDKSAFYFGQKGEFSVGADIGFTKHIKKLIKLNNNPFFQRMNGGRIKAIRAEENFWY